MKSQPIKNATSPFLALLLLLLVWDGTVRFSGIDHLILPSPWSVIAVLANQFQYLSMHAGITILEAIAGFAVGGAVAVALAISFDASDNTKRALYPHAIALKAVPLVALAPLVVAWCGTGVASKIVLSAIISFFPVLVNAVQGFGAIDPAAHDLMRVMAASKWQTFTKLKLPSAIPSIFAGMRVSSTFAVIGAIVAEFIGSRAGIGYVIRNASYYFDTSLMFAAIAIAAASGLLFFGTIVGAEKLVLSWKSADGSVSGSHART